MTCKSVMLALLWLSPPTTTTSSISTCTNGYTSPIVGGWSLVDALYLRPPHVARGTIEPVVWTGQSYGQIVIPVLYSSSGACGHVGPTSEKGTRVYDPHRPAPAIISPMGALLLVCDTEGNNEHDATHLYIESVISMKSFCEAGASFTRGLPLNQAFKVVANAIPRSLLRTVYERVLTIRTYLHGHGNWSLAGYPDDVPWDQGHVCTVAMAVSHRFVSNESVEAEHAHAAPFPPWSSRSSVGGWSF